MARHLLVEKLTKAGLAENLAAVWVLTLRDIQPDERLPIAKALRIMAAYLKRTDDDETQRPTTP